MSGSELVAYCRHPACKRTLTEDTVDFCPHDLPFCERCTWEDGCEDCNRMLGSEVSMTDVERIARVICGAHNGRACKPWEDEDEAWRNTYRDMARAVLASGLLPNPTPKES